MAMVDKAHQETTESLEATKRWKAKEVIRFFEEDAVGI